jgi:flavin reductase (DIM6/NTAB) family NADH-FMN oxidoreductase RutF
LNHASYEIREVDDMTEWKTTELTSEVLRHAYGMFPSGVTAVCAMIDDKPTGMAASSFTSVSVEPPLVSVCVAHTSTTWPLLKRAERLGVSVLASDHSSVARSLSAKVGDRFANTAWDVSLHGAVFVHGSALWLDCRIEAEFRAGDHDIIVLRITALQPYPDVAPMVFHGSKFRQLAS